MGGFRAGLGAHFGVSGAQVDLVLGSVERPGDAVICFWLGQQTRQPIEVVLREYRGRKGQGWGALAQSLGIKPGSDAFHALKRGEIGWNPKPGGGSGQGKGAGNGKDKGKGKGPK
jgi:hypothetical protein